MEHLERGWKSKCKKYRIVGINLDVSGLKEYIIANPDNIEALLEDAGFCKIKKFKDEYRCAHENNSNPTSIRVMTKTLKVNDFARDINGDIITLIQERLALNFPQTLKWIANKLDIEIGCSNPGVSKLVLPFGGFYKNIQEKPIEQYVNKTYDDEILNNYQYYPSQRFLDSHISISTQNKFGIGYDVKSGRITIPWRNQLGELVGIMGRLNKSYLNVDDNKYYPIIKFNKDTELYGYSNNYKDIIQKDCLIITESEKSTMQLDSMGYYCGVSLGGNTITNNRAKMIKALNVSTILVAYDEGLDREIVFNNANKLKVNNSFFNNRVGVILDKDNKLLPFGSKYSPTDLGKEVFDCLVKESVVWI